MTKQYIFVYNFVHTFYLHICILIFCIKQLCYPLLFFCPLILSTYFHPHILSTHFFVIARRTLLYFWDIRFILRFFAGVVQIIAFYDQTVHFFFIFDSFVSNFCFQAFHILAIWFLVRWLQKLHFGAIMKVSQFYYQLFVQVTFSQI